MRDILKASSKTGTGTVVGLLLRGLGTKIMAVTLGPAGMGLYSLLQQVYETVVSFGTLGGQNALVQGLCSREGAERDRYLATTFWLTAASAALSAVILILFAPEIAQATLDRADARSVLLIRWLALPALLGAAMLFLNSVLNGFRSIGMMALAQVAASAVGVLLAYPAAHAVAAGHSLAFVGLMSASFATANILLFIRAYRSGWLAPLRMSPLESFDGVSARRFFSIAGTGLATGLIGAGALLAVRAMIAHGPAGLSGAGVFDVAWTISMAYLMIVLSAFGTYYLPTLAGTPDPESRNHLILQVLRLTTLLTVPLVVAMLALKPLAVAFLYSRKFDDALPIMRWMIIGDYLKAAGWVLAMPIQAYPDMRIFFLTDLAWNAGFVALSALAVRLTGRAEGVGAAFMLLYALYLAYFLYFTRRRYQLTIDRGLALHWLSGLALVGLASWLTWSDTALGWAKSPALVAGGVLFSWLALSADERVQVLAFARRFA